MPRTLFSARMKKAASKTKALVGKRIWATEYNNNQFVCSALHVKFIDRTHWREFSKRTNFPTFTAQHFILFSANGVSHKKKLASDSK